MGGGRGQAEELGSEEQARWDRGGQGGAEGRQRNLGVKNRARRGRESRQ